MNITLIGASGPLPFTSTPASRRRTPSSTSALRAAAAAAAPPKRPQHLHPPLHRAAHRRRACLDRQRLRRRHGRLSTSHQPKRWLLAFIRPRRLLAVRLLAVRGWERPILEIMQLRPARELLLSPDRGRAQRVQHHAHLLQRRAIAAFHHAGHHTASPPRGRGGGVPPQPCCVRGGPVP
jgi:hypothetical protein